MRFNLYFYIILSTVFMGCGLKLSEKKQVDEIAEVESAKCLDQSITELKLYVAGNATDDQAASAFQCMQDVFVSFKDNIRGENNDSYTPEEIALFIETNFVKDSSKISSSFLRQVMKFKVALIGGTSDVVTKAEIQQLINLISIIKPDLIKINKSMKILTLKWTGSRGPEDMDVKEKQFQLVKKDFSRLIQKVALQLSATGEPYQLDNIVDFAKEIILFAKNDSQAADQVEKARSAVKRFKTAFVGGTSAIQDQEWSRLGLILNEGFFQVLRYQYFIKNLDVRSNDAKWVQYEKIATDSTSLVQNILAAKDLHYVSNTEIHDFIVALEPFTSEFKISEDILNSLGDLKLMFLGENKSDRFIWSDGDFEILHDKVPRFFQQIPILIDATQALFPKGSASAKLTYNEFTETEQKAIEATWQLSQLIEHSYSLDSAKEILLKLANGPLKDHLVLPANFDSLFKLGVSGKTVLTGQADNNLTPANLKLLVNVGARAFLNYTEFKLYLNSKNTASPAFYQAAVRLLEKVGQTIQANLVAKSSAFYSTEDIMQFVQVLQQEKHISEKIHLESIQIVVQGLWKNLLNNPDQRIQGHDLPGFNAEALAQLSKHLNSFLKVQQSVNAVFQSHPTLRQEELKSALTSHFDKSSDPELKAGLQQLISVVSTEVPLNFNDEGFLKILTDSTGQYHLADVFRSNAARTISDWIIQAYTADASRLANLTGITVEEANTAFNQFKAVAIDLDAIDAVAADSFISSRIREASLFLTSSNGDLYTNLNELHDLTLHILSGLNRGQAAQKSIAAKCLPAATVVLGSMVEVPEDCLLNFYVSESAAFADMPQFLNLKTTYTEDQQKEFYMNLLKAAGHVPNEKKIVHLGDANLFPHVVQYIEMLYASYDSNHDNILDKDEALVAYPVFKETIRQVAGVKDSQLEGTFIYLLKYGKPPKTLAEKLLFAAFVANPSKWIISTTRLDLGKIFNFIAEATAAPVGPKP